MTFDQIMVVQNYPQLNPWGFLLPFPITMWIGILSSLLVIALLLCLSTRISLKRAFSQAYRLLLSQGIKNV